MQHGPSIKGSLLGDLVREVLDLQKKATISPEDIETRLRPAERTLLEDNVVAADWYEVESFRRLALLLRDRAGDGRDDFIRALGLISGERLLGLGIYQQMEYLDRAELFDARTEKERIDAGHRDLRLLASLSSSLLNFSRWRVVPDPEYKLRHSIEITDAHGFCDELAQFAEGVIDAMSARQGLSGLWTWSRASEDFIVFHMTRDPIPDDPPAKAEHVETGSNAGVDPLT